MADWKNVHLAEQDEKIADLTLHVGQLRARMEKLDRVREAVNERELYDAEQRVQQNPLSLLARMDLEQELRIALASLRVGQAPRLTPEQREAVKIAETLLTDTMSDYGDCEHDVGHCICKYHSGVFNLRAAFPEVFGGEVGNG